MLERFTTRIQRGQDEAAVREPDAPAVISAGERVVTEGPPDLKEGVTVAERPKTP